MQKGEFLIIDEGNTRCKLALFQNDSIITEQNQARVEDLQWANITASKVLFSSVRRSETPDFLQHQFPELYHWDNDGNLPFPSRYQTPKTLGRDRIANVMALHFLTTKNVAKVAIDFGSCITIDIVNQEGIYTGGSISPGFTMQLKALHNYTGQLPLIEPNTAEKDWGDSTASSILTGVMKGINKMIIAMMEDISNQYEPVEFHITGGESKYFEFPNKNHIFANQNLTLIGLKEILKHT